MMETSHSEPDNEEIVHAILQAAPSSSKIVFVSGNFNIVHPGHLRLLRYAQERGDFLVVGINADEGNPASVLNEAFRYEGIRSISFVNYAFILRQSAASFIESLKPAFVVKGKEHEHTVNPEADAVAKYGGELLFSSGDITFSSLDLIRDEIQSLNLSSIKKSADFPQRHGFTMGDLDRLIDMFSELKVVVIGDTIVDEYITCDPIGMSQEDTSLVVSPVMNRKFIGGAAIVASHASSLGANVSFFSVVGDDQNADFVRENLDQFGVAAKLVTDRGRPTSLKQRFRANEKTLLRVSHLSQDEISDELGHTLLEDLKHKLEDASLLIFSDFNYGCLPDWLVREIEATCEERGVVMAADSQSSSQVGDLSRFKNMLLMTPTERELRLAIRDFSSGLVVAAESLRKLTNARNIIVTLGREGSLIHVATKSLQEWQTDRLPAMNTSAKDVAGAGDSLLTAAAMALAAGADIWQSGYLGALAAACQVSRLGNTPLRGDELRAEIRV